MPFQPHHAGLLRLRDELLLQLRPGKAEDHVHHRPALPLHRRPVELRILVDDPIEARRLLPVHLLDLGEAALAFKPCQDVPYHVDAEGGRGVVERLVLRVGAELEDLGDVLPPLLHQFLRNDDHHHSGRADVLLGSGVDHAELRDVEGPPEEVARHVGDQRHGAGVGEAPGAVDIELHAVYGLVRGDVQVGGRGIDLHLGGRRHAGVALLLAFSDADALDRHGGPEQRRDKLRLAERLLAPGAGDEVLGGLPLLEEVHGHLGEQRGCPTLEKQDLVARGDAEELPDEGDGLVVNPLVLLAAVAVLHHRHAAPREVEELFAGALQSGKRKGGGSGVEIDLSAHVVLAWARRGFPRIAPRHRSRAGLPMQLLSGRPIFPRSGRTVKQKGEPCRGVPEILRVVLFCVRGTLLRKTDKYRLPRIFFVYCRLYTLKNVV